MSYKSCKVNHRKTKAIAQYLVYCACKILLNQVHAGLQPAHAWFLEIVFVRDVCVSVCLCVHPQGIYVNEAFTNNMDVV